MLFQIKNGAVADFNIFVPFERLPGAARFGHNHTLNMGKNPDYFLRSECKQMAGFIRDVFHIPNIFRVGINIHLYVNLGWDFGEVTIYIPRRSKFWAN